MLSRDREETRAQLRAAHARIAELEAEVARSSGRDPLVATLLTLPAFRAQLELDMQRAVRYRHPLAVAVIDLDRFRYLNIRRGYGAGDLLLAAVGRVISEGTRARDLACRAGADEFLLLLPETSLDEARALVERIHVALEQVEAGGWRGAPASSGLAVMKPGHDADSLLAAAAAAMERAKAAGGGQLSVWEASEPDSGDGLPAIAAGGEVVGALAQALEERDSYTAQHSESVVEMTTRVAQALALDAAEQKVIRSAALLHDIGKVGIPDEILHKAGPLDAGEWEIMRQHPAIGERILRAIPGMGAVARIVRHEHERWDGTGYPDRLAGGEIPIGARIILACDAYHAMTSDRPYRRALSNHAALAELTSNAGTQFDPSVVETLVGYVYGRRQSGLAAVSSR